MNKLLAHCLTGALLITASSAAFAADTSSDAKLPQSTLAACTNFINTVAAKKFDSLPTNQQIQAENNFILQEGSGSANQLTECYKQRTCQHQLSDLPDCEKYLSLWYWLSTQPTVPKSSGAPVGEATPTAPVEKKPAPQIITTPAPTTPTPSTSEPITPAKPKETINWL